MKKILICDDSLSDISLMKTALEPLSVTVPFEIDYLQDIHSLITKTQLADYSLLLLDLEFSDAGINSLLLINKLPPQLPVIIVSHLEHYQRQTQLNVNIRAFISKRNMISTLPIAVKQVLNPNTDALYNEHFLFPSPKEGVIAQKITIRNVRYIHMFKRGYYEIHYTFPGTPPSGSSDPTNIIRSKPFYVVCKAIEDQSIQGLTPISQNIIINNTMIENITYLQNGRLELSLFGLEGEIFSVGDRYMRYLKDTLSLKRTPSSYRWKDGSQ